MPSITQLRYLIAVDRVRHFGKAAKDCTVSQPSLSMQIQKAEDDLGFPVFDRTKKPIRPSSKGRIFLAHARKLLADYDALMAQSKSESEEISGEFVLYLIPTVIPYLLPKFLEPFLSAYPRVELTIKEATTEECIEAIKEGVCDSAILALPIEEKGLRERSLFYEPFFVYAHHDHPLLDAPNLTQKHLIDDSLWLLEEGHCFRNQVLSFCSLAKSSRVGRNNLHFEAGSLETLRQIVRHSGGFTVVPKMLVDTLGRKEIKSHVAEFASPVPHREIGIVYLREQWKKDIIAAIMEVIDVNFARSYPKKPSAGAKVLDLK